MEREDMLLKMDALWPLLKVFLVIVGSLWSYDGFTRLLIDLLINLVLHYSSIPVKAIVFPWIKINDRRRGQP
jgi:hypothetical protein